MQNWLRRLRFELMYLGAPPWDTGISPPELLDFLQRHAPGRALDLGCGTGLNVLTLAKAGWQAEGVDFAGRAVRSARRRLAEAGVEARVRRGDVTRLKDARGPRVEPYDLVLDIGCYHGLRAEGRAAYQRNLMDLLAPGGHFLLYANWRAGEDTPWGITQADVDGLSARLALENRQDSLDQRGRMASWFLFLRA